MSARIVSGTMRIFNLGVLIKNSTLIPICGCQQSYYSVNSRNLLNAQVEQVPEEQRKKKTSIIPKITLISGDELTITTLEEAQRLSKRRDLKLVKIIDLDTKTRRPVYKLMTGSEYHAEDLKQREQKKQMRQASTLKGEKVLMLSHNISEHDLQTDVKKISKWIAKSYEVRVVINGDSSNMEKAEKVYNFLEQSLKSEVRFLQRRQKGSDIKFQIIPPKKNKSDGDKNL